MKNDYNQVVSASPLHHHASYDELLGRLNRFPQGAPPSEALYQILQILFSQQEAHLVSQLPIKPFDAAAASRIWKLPINETRTILDALSSRALLVDVEQNAITTYTLPPPMAGFIEFSMMRVRTDIDQQALAELFYQYCNVEEDFIKSLFTRGETQLGRVYVHEPAIPETTVLDYERASHIIRSATHRAVGMCYCRHKMQRVGRACSAPLQDICMTFNGSAESLSRHGYARAVDIQEGLDVLNRAYENNLVQFGENSREGVNFICNCCGCCCEAMIAARRFSLLRPVHTTNFLPSIQIDQCSGCGKCVSACPVEALGLVSANNPHAPNQKKARLNEEICLGCGVCTRTCPTQSITLIPRQERVITPLNSVHRVVMMAVERGNLQDLIFDNRVLWSHRMLSAFLGAILKLPPIQRTIASRQVKSRYLEQLIQKIPV